MAFKIKDGVRIGTTDIFNNSAESLNIKVKNTVVDPPGSGVVAIKTESLGATSYEQTLQAKTGTIALTSDIGNGALSVTVAEDGTTGNSVYITTGTGFSANVATNKTYDVHVGPALKDYADVLTGATTGLVRKDAADSIELISVLGVSYGGTGISSYTQGDMLYYSANDTLSKLAKGTGRYALVMNAGATAPEWQHSMQSLLTAAGDIIYASAANTPARLAKGTDGQVLKLVSGLPAWTADTDTDTLQSIADDTVDADRFVTFVVNATGAQTGLSSTKIKFNPSTGLLTLTGDIAVNGGDITTTATTATIFNTNATTLSVGGAATTATFGYSSTATSTTNISTGAVASTNTKTINIGTGGATGSTTKINLGQLITDEVVIAGNLIVNGETTTINVGQLDVEDKNIVLGKVTTPTDDTADQGGITLQGATNKTILWDKISGRWVFNQAVEAVSLAVTGYANKTVVDSTGKWVGLTVTAPYGGTGISSYAVGDILYASATDALSKLAKGTAYQSLNMNAGATAPEWQASLQSVLTTAGDTIYASANNTPARLAKGTAYQSLNMNAGATAPEWQASLQSVLTAAGDMIYASAANTPARLAKGTDGQVLKLVSGFPTWSTDIDTNTDTLQSIADDTSANSRFITFVNSATGAQTGGSSANIKFVPSTGTLTTTKISTTEIALGASAATPKVFTNVITPAAITANTATAVDTWDADLYRSAIYVIQITQGTEYQFGEVRVLHDGTSVYLTEYAVLENGLIGSAGTQQPTFTGAISGTAPNLVFTLSVTIGDAATTNANMIIERKLFAV